MKRRHRTQRPNRCKRRDLPAILHYPPHRPYPTLHHHHRNHHKAKYKRELKPLQDLRHLLKERYVLDFFARRTPRHVDAKYMTRHRLQTMHGDAAEEDVLNAAQKAPNSDLSSNTLLKIAREW